MDNDCFKTPPNMVNSNHAKQGQPKNNNNEIPMSLPSLTQSPSPSQKAATASKRIINKIPLDFKKLKEAGLDRKLAEVLSKQNLSSTKKIASATTSSASSSASTSSAAAVAVPASAKLSTETASLTQAQRQHGRQSAALPVRKKTAPNLVVVDEQTLHVKALIKNKILNKLAKSPVTTATTTTTTAALPIISSSPKSSFSAPIAKADLTAPPKLLLNLVNQLPKHRAMCGVRSPPTRARQPESTLHPKVHQHPSSSSTQQRPPRQQHTQPVESPNPKPLIVLENKVLAPNEKIDVSVLRLPKMHSTELTSIAVPFPEKLSEMPEKSTVKAKSAPRLGAKKIILNANKLKVPREQLAQMAKDISNQAMQRMPQSVAKPIEDVHSISSNITGMSSPTNIETSLITSNSKTTNIQTSSISSVVADALPTPKSTSANVTLTTPAEVATAPSNSKSSSSSSSDCSNNVISAVDFIAQLKANNSLNLTKYMNLSAEEMSMNALFSGCETALPLPGESKAEEEFPIGKILKMEDMDILHSTMNVDENESNVLCISPNAIKLQKSIEIEEPTVDNKTASWEQESVSLKETSEPLSLKDNPSLAAAPTLMVTSPQEETKKSEEQEEETPLAQLTPLAPRLPLRPKKGKINLVQRNKRASAEKFKSPEETVKKTDMETDHEKDHVSKADIPEDLNTKHNANLDKFSEENISNIAHDQDKICAESSTKSLVEEQNIKEIEKTNLDKAIENEFNIMKIDNITKNNMSKKEEVQDKSGANKSVYKNTNAEIVKNERTTNIDTTINSVVNIVYNISEQQIPKQVELKNQTDNREINYEVVQKRSKINLDTEIESEVNIDTIITKENAPREAEVQSKIDAHRKNSVDKEEIEEIVKQNIKNNLNVNEDIQVDPVKITTCIKTENSLSNQELGPNDNVITSNKDPDIELTASEEIAIEAESEDAALNTTKERDLTQFYHPPKMPKLKKKINNNDEVINCNDIIAETEPTISLVRILSQEEPTPQGEAQLPFRQDPKKIISAENSSKEVTGIQNLLNKLTAENVMPPSKEIKTEEPVKAPRKKLVKTRPVLSAKRASKAVSSKAEALHPRKRALLAESKANGAHRVPTSSTSDDDGDMFHGFDNEASSSKIVTDLKNIGTDISDDATPDYDETEEDPQPEEISLTKKPKTNPEQKLEKIIEQTESKEIEEKSEPELRNDTTESLDNSQLVDPVDVKKKRGRPFKNANKKPEEALTVQETKDNATPLTRKRKRQSKDINKDDAQSESMEVLPLVQPDSLSAGEETPVAKRPRKRRSKNATVVITTNELDTITEPEPESEIKTVKRRGRKPKTTPDAIESTPDTMTTSTPDALMTSTLDAMITSTPTDMVTPKKRGRKPKYLDLLSKKVKSEEMAENTDETVGIAKHEGPNNWPHAPDFDLRLLLIRNRDQMESGEDVREDGRGEGSEQCGLCLVRCDKNDWQMHLSEHYGVGWTTDKTPMIITRGILINWMTKYAKRGIRLKCRLCERSFGSGLGMLLHLEGCGVIQERVECEICKRSYSKLFIVTHSRTCSQSKELRETSVEAKPDESIKATVFSNAGRAKRQSTIKAETKLQKIAEHLKKPDEKANKDFDADSSDYDVAADKESSEEYESEGVDSNEDADQTNDDNKSTADSSTIKKNRKKGKKRCSSEASVTTSKPSVVKIIKSGIETGDRWKYFIKKNYTCDALYTHLLPRFEQLLPAAATKLLPSRESTSMRYAYAYDNEDNNEWIQLAPLESFNTKSEYFCHLGKPVKEVAWVPLPPSVKTQYLLCSQRSRIHGFTRQFKHKQEDDLLLLLECSMSSTEKDNTWPLQTRLHYGIHVLQGPVNTFAFMPSGGYDKSANRMALLAVGSSSSAVIYALPLELAHLDNNVTSKDAVVVLEPVITLTLDIDNPVQDPCTKICWSQASGHNLLVTGYASGNIAFWDIADEDGFNCFTQNNQRHLLPASFFYFGERNIQFLDLHYDSNGAHWLAAGAAVRKFWVYDISNWSQPVSVLGDVLYYLYMGCVSWSPLWESLTIGFSELTRAQFTRLASVHPVDISSSSVTLDVMLNSIRATHFNCDQILLASIADNGDVKVLKTNESNSQKTLRQNSDCSRLSTTEACCLSDVAEQNFVTPEVFQRDYGLIFRPLILERKKETSSVYQNPKRQPSYNLRSMMRLNCVRWNWNAPASYWLAIGAEHGLLRIINCES
ncbi:uncharacterized protein LOC117787400 [Drosophila innubila]|uniref:uncharacterized protein LOC117787400 n=1 Tax=Drosophila innubila TaxID=198719 RepID=UPI00148D862A|nr:uncharacterized protein LOC117787400 [Drosophila innubila]